MIVIADESKYQELKEAVAGLSVRVMAGEAAVVEAAQMQSDYR